MDDRLRKILPLVEKPGRYTGGETNSIKKDLSKVSLKVALAFPDLYEIGISNLGLQILYHVLNSRDDIAAERVYSVWGDMEERMRQEGIPLCSLESTLPLSDFDIIGVSLQHELAYTNMLNMLDLGGVPLLASERGDNHPLVLAGGPSSFNPETASDFIDAFLIGDGEEGIVDICDAYIKWKEKGGNRHDLLLDLSKIDGVYIPSLFSFDYSDEGKIKKIIPINKEYTEVQRRLVPDINNAPYPTSFIVPNVRPVHDRISLEVARGCSRFCHFCQAGYIYLPVRERSPEKIREIGERSLSETGLDEVALLSLSTGDYSCLEGLLPDLASRYKKNNVNLSFPSLRVDTITPSIMGEMKKMRSNSFTIAPEAGTQRLRDLINKGVTEEQILDTVKEMSQAGCKAVKLYFMIGLPTETMEDLDGIIDLSRAILKTGRSARGITKVTVSISAFVPKAHTPFQWVQQDSAAETAEKHSYLRTTLRDRGISLKWQDPFMSVLEGVFSRGDRRVGAAILGAFKKGCRFDSWSDQLNRSHWEEAFTDAGIEISDYLRVRSHDEILPWDLVDTGVDKSFLFDELKRSDLGALTEDCRYGKCSVCGVCDHKIVKINLFKDDILSPLATTKEMSSPLKTRMRVQYSKEGPARFLGHIDCMGGLVRALRRSGLPLVYSVGFHPSPKISFGSPIPLGTESDAEYFDIEIEGNISAEDFMESIRAAAPSICAIKDAFVIPLKSSSITNSVETEIYIVKADPNVISAKSMGEVIAKFIEAKEWIIVKRTKKGEKKIDLKKELTGLKVNSSGDIEMDIAALGGRKVKPAEAIAGIWNLDESQKKDLDIMKSETIFIAGL